MWPIVRPVLHSLIDTPLVHRAMPSISSYLQNQLITGTHASARSACLEMLEATHSASHDAVAPLDAMTSDYPPMFA